MENEALTQAAGTDSEQGLVLPYLIFKIDEVLYAVNGETINTIFVLDQPVTRVPMTESHIKGIINVRGEVVPLVDIRTLFGMPTADQEKNVFEAMIESRKQDHLNWVAALKESVHEGTEFKLALDPHKCKFGKWYDNFQSTHTELSFALRQIDEPHQKLHACAAEALDTCAECKSDSDQFKHANGILEKLEKEYVPTLLGLMDQMVESHSSAAKQMVVILQKDKTQIGVLVDEVMEVTDIVEVCPLDDITNTHHSRFVHGVGSAEQYEKDILMLDVDQIVNNSHSIVSD